MSVNIKIVNAIKKYGDNVIIPGISLDINEGELFTLLGPSGCGKTTLLRMIAGFNTIEGGDFYFGDTHINKIEPEKRNIGMVFQNYAIFPHMTVRKNVAFGLRNRKYPKEKINRLTQQFLELMQIEDLANRLPDRLSGGQQQRVALARALVVNPDVLLMDEPLSNLDAKLRVEMRTVIKNIQRDVGITTIYVTHDQEEAMAISDRVAVMNQGTIQQIGSPKSLYQRPANLFVSTFIGRTNVIPAELEMEQDAAFLRVSPSYRVQLYNLREDRRIPGEVKLSVRPEEFVIDAAGSEGIRATVQDSIFLGLNTHYFVELETGEKVEIIQESTIDSILAPGTEIRLTIKHEKINVFSMDGAENLLRDKPGEEIS